MNHPHACFPDLCTTAEIELNWLQILIRTSAHFPIPEIDFGVTFDFTAPIQHSSGAPCEGPTTYFVLVAHLY